MAVGEVGGESFDVSSAIVKGGAMWMERGRWEKAEMLQGRAGHRGIFFGGALSRLAGGEKKARVLPGAISQVKVRTKKSHQPYILH